MIRNKIFISAILLMSALAYGQQPVQAEDPSLLSKYVALIDFDLKNSNSKLPKADLEIRNQRLRLAREELAERLDIARTQYDLQMVETDANALTRRVTALQKSPTPDKVAIGTLEDRIQNLITLHDVGSTTLSEKIASCQFCKLGTPALTSKGKLVLSSVPDLNLKGGDHVFSVCLLDYQRTHKNTSLDDRGAQANCGTQGTSLIAVSDQPGNEAKIGTALRVVITQPVEPQWSRSETYSTSGVLIESTEVNPKKN